MSDIDFFLCKDENNYDLNDIVNSFSKLKKYSNLIIIQDNPDRTTGIIKLDNEKRKYSKKDFVFHLPKSRRVTDKNKLENVECSICKCEIVKNEFYRELPGCKHIFHKKCIDQWFYKSQDYNCPNCRNHFYKI